MLATHLKFLCGVTDFRFTNQQIQGDVSKNQETIPI